MEKQFPNIEQYTDTELDAIIQAAEAILNAHKQSKLSLYFSHGWQTFLKAA